MNDSMRSEAREAMGGSAINNIAIGFESLLEETALLAPCSTPSWKLTHLSGIHFASTLPSSDRYVIL